MIDANLKSAFFTVTQARPLLADGASVILINTLSFGAVSTPMTGAASPDLASAMRAWG